MIDRDGKIRIEKKHNEGLYKFVRRNLESVEGVDLKEVVGIINSNTIQEAALRLGMDSIQLMIFVGHLYRAKIVREVRVT
ncbi:MAG: hypothetical protein H0Z19_05120 [Archaeoglobus sp.]|uniref:hypothetical protein n=1 Tax=Archaeoglobus sp. TaxID=1872626 RepID=UPI001D6AEC36|nr:hypothetical protein [Archaeoglobus sp.]MBO8179848.1 hypothetical protein [Archaeoglobus sp.]